MNFASYKFAELSSTNTSVQDVFVGMALHPDMDGVSHFLEWPTDSFQLSRSVADIVRVPPSARIVVVGEKGDELRLKGNDEEFTYFPVSSLLNHTVKLEGARKVKVYTMTAAKRGELARVVHTFNGVTVALGQVIMGGICEKGKDIDAVAAPESKAENIAESM